MFMKGHIQLGDEIGLTERVHIDLPMFNHTDGVDEFKIIGESLNTNVPNCEDVSWIHSFLMLFSF